MKHAIRRSSYTAALPLFVAVVLLAAIPLWSGAALILLAAAIAMESAGRRRLIAAHLARASILTWRHRIKAAIFGVAVMPALLGVAGCSTLSTLSSASVTQSQLDATMSAYVGAFLTPAATYRQLGYCATGTSATLAKPCADRAIVAKLQASNAAVQTAFAAVQGIITSGQTSGLVAAYGLLEADITAADSIAATLGVQ